MAIGLGLFFNVNLPQNFNSPYKSRNFRDYWRRWHISLSKFLSDYIFRSVYKSGAGSTRFYAAVMLTFLVSGFWHGAGWRFVLWGAVNGIFVCAAHFMTRRKWEMPFVIAWMLTFIGILGTRVIFVANSTSEALYVMKKMVDLSVFNGWAKSAIFMEGLDYMVTNAYVLTVLGISLIIVFFMKNTSQIRDNFTFSKKYAIITGLLLTLSLFQMSNVADFLYFQF
jgi:D-alanyl-lipoteichoic acid acyltransferase DltB (MBOAT superfamily)